MEAHPHPTLLYGPLVGGLWMEAHPHPPGPLIEAMGGSPAMQPVITSSDHLAHAINFFQLQLGTGACVIGSLEPY